MHLFINSTMIIYEYGPAFNFLTITILFVLICNLQFLGNLRNLRDSHAAVAVGASETVGGEPTSVTRIISECEAALTYLNRDLSILSASIAREQGEETTY